jgi:hypothetical protein
MESSGKARDNGDEEALAPEDPEKIDGFLGPLVVALQSPYQA